MPRRYGRDAYSAAIDKVRSEHASTVKHGQLTIECPRCGTRQVVNDVPGQRVCVKCGFEFPRML